MLVCWACTTLSHLLGFWRWYLLSTLQGLACHVFSQNTGSRPICLVFFFFLHKIAYFSLQMGVWGSSEVGFFFLLHTHHLWSPGISDKFPDCLWCRLVSTQSVLDPSLGLSLFEYSTMAIISSTEYWCCGLSVFFILNKFCKGSSESLQCPACITHQERTWECHYRQKFMLCSVLNWWFSSVHFLLRALLWDAMLLLASSLLP